MCPKFGQIYFSMKEAEMAIPHLFLCPISLDLFTDPVTLCTGQTYDRPSIEKWLSAGNSTCPVTMQKLSDKSMVPNHTLRHLIDRWLVQSSHKSHSKHSKIPPHDLSSIFSLKHTLESHHSPIDTKLQTLGSLKIMSQELPTNNSFLIQWGFFKSIIDLLFSENQTRKCFSQEYNEFIEELLALALKLIPYCSLAPLNMLRDKQNFDQFLLLFDHGTVAVKNDQCQLIESISSSPETKELCSDLGKKQTLLQRLVLLIQESTEASDYGIKAILALCSIELNRVHLVREGIVNGLITYLSNSEKNATNLCAKAMKIIQMVIGLEGVKEGLIDDERGVKAMVKMVFRVCVHEGSESAIDVLMGLCSDSVVVRERAIFGGVLSQLLLLIQSQCGGRVKNKARVLLKLLRSMWNQDMAHM